MTTGSNHSLVAVQVIGAPKSAETASQEIVDSMSSDERAERNRCTANHHHINSTTWASGESPEFSGMRLYASHGPDSVMMSARPLIVEDGHPADILRRSHGERTRRFLAEILLRLAILLPLRGCSSVG